MILIISYPEDPHAQAVMQTLNRMSADYFLLDLAKFPRQARLDCHYHDSGYSLQYCEKGQPVKNLRQIRSVWWRRPQPFEFEEHLNDVDFAQNECKEAIDGLWSALELEARWTNPPLFDEAAHRKGYQLAIASRMGMLAPETHITNSVKQAQHFIGAGKKLIYKPFGGTVNEWRETRVVGDQEIENLAKVRHAPLIFQEFIPGVDYRVTVVGDKIFPAAIDARQGSYPVDFRINTAGVKISEASLPDELNAQILQLMKRLRLNYGAIDFRRHEESGEFYFLEINPAGQWLFVEDQTRQPISRTIAEYLATNARIAENSDSTHCVNG